MRAVCLFGNRQLTDIGVTGTWIFMHIRGEILPVHHATSAPLCRPKARANAIKASIITCGSIFPKSDYPGASQSPGVLWKTIRSGQEPWRVLPCKNLSHLLRKSIVSSIRSVIREQHSV
jgi:hypothetical protein